MRSFADVHSECKQHVSWGWTQVNAMHHVQIPYDQHAVQVLCNKGIQYDMWKKEYWRSDCRLEIQRKATKYDIGNTIMQIRINTSLVVTSKLPWHWFNFRDDTGTIDDPVTWSSDKYFLSVCLCLYKYFYDVQLWFWLAYMHILSDWIRQR